MKKITALATVVALVLLVGLFLVIPVLAADDVKPLNPEDCKKLAGESWEALNYFVDVVLFQK